MKYTTKQLTDIINTCYDASDKCKLGPLFFDSSEVLPMDKWKINQLGMAVFFHVLTSTLSGTPPKEDWTG